ncbi:MAG: hypothetical protein CVU65_00150 [Deltaproteobacteria bacterium HGW-Deltaproteobacteria-22]|jgi:integrase|nr:MAG: hypothetical protein CVU65_00150 [Deltaproteobacteria bacterium HGW-Deltaproteobacteria-22]
MSEIIVAYPYERRGRVLFRVDHCFKDHEGIPRRLKKRGFDSRGAAISWGEKELSMIQNGIKKVVPGHKRGPKTIHTVESGLRAILDWLELTGHLKPSTRYIHECSLRKHVFPVIGELAWVNFSQSHCDQLMEAARKISTPRHIRVLKTCLKVADKSGLPPLSLTLESIKEIVNIKTDFLTVEELESLCKHASPIWSCVFRFLFHTGLRIGEMCALEWNDLDLRAKFESIRVQRTVYFTDRGPQVMTPKNGRTRVLPLNSEAVSALKNIFFLRFPGEKNITPLPQASLSRRLVIISDKKQGYERPRNAGFHLKKSCRSAGLRPISPHMLRHSHASCMVQAGVPLPVVSTLLGHSSLEVTGRYAHLSPDNLRAGVNILQNQTTANGIR